MITILIIMLSCFSTNCSRWYSASLQNNSAVESFKEVQNFSPILTINPEQYYMTAKFKEGDTESKYINSEHRKQEEHFKNIIHQTQHTFKPKRKISRCREPPRRLKKFKTEIPRDSRFLDIFEVIEFDHVPCTSSNGLEGLCLHEYDCQKSGGTNMGECADGYGTCCIVQFTCESRSASPKGWFTNREFPLPTLDRLSCTITLEKAWPEVKQLRLDFLTFELLPPNSGNCEQDQFIITGQDVNNVLPILCGINTGQHVYVEVGNSAGPINLSIQTVTPESRIFAIKITQLLPNNALSPPSGCLQYFQEEQGYLVSFNYRDISEISIGKTSSYLNNLNYVICIQRQPGSCSITYKNAGYMQIVNYNGGLPILPPRQAGVEIFNCPSDWLLISAVRLCGERLNDGSAVQDFSFDAPVTDSAVGPIMVWFRSDSVYTGRGFKLHYQQNLCLNAS
ncbi:uncharacterized protein LOC125060930 isoform X2 [Pieris napi]|uniref:uncharacterized protein LOC125060930 isoform X2 n=1 Tax=Pieris napi TaxID=78633 RepID=UPI001FB9D8CE|nr:uncharacterized protein LOC125060930 isoform X2 [Pieris napi]